MNEQESYRYIKENLDYFGMSHEELENYLADLVENGPFYYPLALLNRKAALLPGFGDAGSQVLSATGRKDLVLEIRSLTAALVVIEVFLDYHWRITGKPGFVTAISLTGKTQLKLREWATNMISPSIDWNTIVAAVYLDTGRMNKINFKTFGSTKIDFIDLLLPGTFDSNGILWACSDMLKQLLLEPISKKSKLENDSAYLHIRDSLETNEPSSLAAYLFRVFSKRHDRRACRELLNR